MALATLDRQDVDRFARAFEELFDRGDAAAMAGFYAEDAEVMAPQSDVVRGRDAIEAFFEAASAAARRVGMCSVGYGLGDASYFFSCRRDTVTRCTSSGPS